MSENEGFKVYSANLEALKRDETSVMNYELSVAVCS